jgi:hypothetical protein
MKHTDEIKKVKEEILWLVYVVAMTGLLVVTLFVV